MGNGVPKSRGSQVVWFEKCVSDSYECMCVSVPMCACSITYVPAEYLEEYKTSLEQAKDDVFSGAAPLPDTAPKYVLTLPL